MTFDEYQILANVTAAKSPRWDHRRAILALGLVGEAGEVGEIVKKEVGHGHPADPDKIAKEIGDVLWYAAVLAYDYGLQLSAIAQANIDKLKARYPDGFSTERSINREGEGS